jgi:hypothetical protein
MGGIAHDGGRSGKPVVFAPRRADVVLGALSDVKPIGPLDDSIGVIAAGLFPPLALRRDPTPQVNAPSMSSQLMLTRFSLDSP